MSQGTLREKCEFNFLTCKCTAHQSSLQWVWQLIEIPEPLTDAGGWRLADALMPKIFKRAKLNFTVEGCRQGTENTVDYIIKLTSGESVRLTGWPDFSVTRPLSPFMYRRRMHRLHGIGEIQSKPGVSPTTKTATLAQARIYGVGQFVKTPQKRE